MTNDLDDRDRNPACGTQVQAGPTADLNPRSLRIGSFPDSIRFALAALVFTLKTVPILAPGPQLARKASWGGAIEDPIAFDPQQATRFDISHTCQERRTGVPTIADNDRTQPTGDQPCHHRQLRAVTSVASSIEGTRAVSSTKVPWPACCGKSTTLLITHSGQAARVFLGRLAMGATVRSAAISASGRYKLLVSTPRKAICPGSGSGAKVRNTPRRRLASI